jgi:hypothetical protein
MTEFQIAHINERGVNVMVVFVDSSVRFKSSEEQNELATQLQLCAASAGLAGNVAMIWQGGFWAPNNQHAFFRSPGGSYAELASRINKSRRCG